jgi:DNA-binding protein WhiA
MTTAERDLVDALRAELAVMVPPRRCCRAAELAGLAGVSESRRKSIIRLGLRLRPHGDEVSAGAPAPEFEWGSAADHCRISYLRGRFLGHGSLSLASGRTHLEFVVPIEEAEQLCEQLTQLEMPASWRARRGRGVVTWKSVEKVGTFLKLLGGGAALLELESRQVSRSVRGDLNRVINAESANLARAVAASARQMAAIDELEADGRLAKQPYLVRVVAAARREEPEATFTELAERLQLHRSAVQRALDRIERLALHSG